MTSAWAFLTASAAFRYRSTSSIPTSTENPVQPQRIQKVRRTKAINRMNRIYRKRDSTREYPYGKDFPPVSPVPLVKNSLGFLCDFRDQEIGYYGIPTLTNVGLSSRTTSLGSIPT